MRAELCLGVIGFTRASDADHPGLRGWAKFRIGEFQVDGFVVRVDAFGVYRLEFPARIDRMGRRHPVLRHTDRRAHRELGHRLLAELERGGWLA